MSEKCNEDKWTHYMLTIDLEKNHIDTFVNFRPVHVDVHHERDYIKFGYEYSGELKSFFDMRTLYMGSDQNVSGCKLVDDVMIIDGAVSPEIMEKYYKNIFSEI